MKIALIGIGIAVLGAFFIIQDLGYQTNTDPNAPDPNDSLDKFNSPEQQLQCDPSYSSVCISSPPPDLDCGDIPHQNFEVLQPDPHGFDGDSDGIGCES